MAVIFAKSKEHGGSKINRQNIRKFRFNSDAELIIQDLRRANLTFLDAPNPPHKYVVSCPSAAKASGMTIRVGGGGQDAGGPVLQCQEEEALCQVGEFVIKYFFHI